MPLILQHFEGIGDFLNEEDSEGGAVGVRSVVVMVDSDAVLYESELEYIHMF